MRRLSRLFPILSAKPFKSIFNVLDKRRQSAELLLTVDSSGTGFGQKQILFGPR